MQTPQGIVYQPFIPSGLKDFIQTHIVRYVILIISDVVLFQHVTVTINFFHVCLPRDRVFPKWENIANNQNCYLET